jgi:GGDEF domain-containing protein
MVNNQHDFQKIRQQLLKESKLKNKYIIVQDNIKFINDLYNHDMLSTYKLSQIVNIIQKNLLTL